MVTLRPALLETQKAFNLPEFVGRFIFLAVLFEVFVSILPLSW